MSKKALSILLAMCMVISCISIGVFTSNAVTVDTDSVSASTGPQDEIQGSAVLHCFNWSYNNIKANLQAIKDAGYTAVQTSPVQKPKDYSSSWQQTSTEWWKLYQPLSLSISNGNTWLGTKAELKSLCDTAESMGIKVIVDVVANHLAGEGPGYGNLNSGVDSLLKNSAYFHNYNSAAHDGDRYAMTMGHIGMPDLNTGNSTIQTHVKNFLVDCINQGVDGFRFDAAKHIELPTDSGNSSQFWPTVINGSQAATDQEIYYYGELLGGFATSVTNYTKYMSVTDTYSSDSTLVAANNGNASWLASSNYSTTAAADKVVLWSESHDTYMGSSGTAGITCTSSISDSTITKSWAMVGSRADSTSLFFARPAATMGTASTNTTWKSTAVSEVNKFKNYFDGQSEYLTSSGSIAYNERGTSGVVLVNCGGTSTSVSVTANKMKAGTYKDQITGNTFTVSNGKITGNIGSTGVAVVYNAVSQPTASVTPGSTTYKTDTLTLTLNYSDATSGQYSIDGGTYKSFTNGTKITIGSGVDYGTQTTVSVKASNGTTTSDAVTYTYTKLDPSAVQKVYFDNSTYKWSNVYAYIYDGATGTSDATWPGTKMTLDSSTGYYVYEVPDDFAYGLVIFTESSSATTNRYPADGVSGIALNGKNMIMRANYTWEEYSEEVATTVAPTTVAPTTVAPTTVAPTTVAPTTVAPTTVAPTTVAPTTQPVTTEPVESDGILIGDTNGDGSVTVSDATIIQRHLVGLTTLTGDLLTAADVDKNNLVNIHDATYIQFYLVDIERSSNYCGTYVGDEEEPTTQPTTVAPTTQPTTAPPTTVPPTTQPVTQPSTYTLTFTRPYSGWSENIYCYYWSDSNTAMTSWPGKKMTYSSTNSYFQKLYTVDIPADVDYIIFSDSNGVQTVDIPFDGSATRYYTTTTTSGKYNVSTW